MSRFYDADAASVALLDQVQAANFPNLAGARVRLIMDEKLQLNKLVNRVIFAYIKKPSEVESFLDTGEFDYFVFLNELTWEMASEDNRRRILSHELCHAVVDEKGNFKIAPHEVEDFYVEIERNKEDPMWSSDLAELVRLRHEQMKDDKES